MKENIIVTGGSGLVGSYLKKIIPNAIYLSSKNFDLTKEDEVLKMYKTYNPEIVVHLAAKVGGILDNISKPAEYFLENIKMNSLLVEYAYKFQVKKFIGVLSSCIYPDTVPNYPLKEEDLHLGPPTPTNFSYGYAKRCLAILIDSYNQQFGTRYQYLTPCNLFGVGDKNEENKSHYVTSLIKKIIQAKISNQDSITLFGDGTPLRQFMYAADFASVIYSVLENNIYDSFNVCGDENLTIKEIAYIALEACEAQHLNIVWDSSKPNGQFRKDMCLEKMKKILPNFKSTTLLEGIKETYKTEYDKIGK
jgi:GDP-L-fucose synthase